MHPAQQHKAYMKRFLFIDDSAAFLNAMRSVFKDNPNVFYAECGNITMARESIERHKPDVLFLDHNLSPDGEEGFEIAVGLQAEGSTMKIYSTTDAKNVAIITQYGNIGIVVLGKISIHPFINLIDEGVDMPGIEQAP